MITKRSRVTRTATVDIFGVIVAYDGTEFLYTHALVKEWNFAAQVQMRMGVVRVTDSRTEPPTVHDCAGIIEAMNWTVERVSGNQRA